MVNCPIKQCGRKFENEETMLEHVRRRHPESYGTIRQDTTKSLIEKQHAQQQQLSKLPKLAKLMSKEGKLSQKAMEMPIRSSSKTRKLQSTNLSSIIQESRATTAAVTTNLNSIATRRPSLTKKLSSTDLKGEKLPPIEKQLKKTIDPILAEPVKKTQSTQQFYTTLQDFKSKDIKLRSSSKDKKSQLMKKTQSKESQPSEPLTLRNTMTALSGRNTQQISNSKKKAYLRPTKKIQRKPSQKDKLTSDKIPIDSESKPDFDQRTVTIKSWPQSIFTCPGTKKIQILFLNNCNLSGINLNSLQSLIQLSATHNKLRDMDFLKYPKNHNIKNIHLDHNEITEVYIPPRTKKLTLSFNQISSQYFPQLCTTLKKSAPDLQEIDLSFNQIRKANNYKLKLLASGGRLKKIDGLTVTKIDVEMMEELLVLESKQKGLIPLGSPSQGRPSTAVSEFEEPADNTLISKSIAQLQKQQKQYQKLISSTSTQLKIIKKQNQIISSELTQLKQTNKELQLGWDSAALLKKLQKQCEFLELLNIMQYADQEELVGMVERKKQELGIAID